MKDLKIRKLDAGQLNNVVKYLESVGVKIGAYDYNELDKRADYSISVRNISHKSSIKVLYIYYGWLTDTSFNLIPGEAYEYFDFESEFMKTRKARLLFTENCMRNCKGCCMKNWKGEKPNLILQTELVSEFDEIYITGGEPMLYPDSLLALIMSIKKNSEAKVFLYTALPYPLDKFTKIIEHVDGVTLTLHQVKDVELFKALELAKLNLKDKTMRLNSFVKKSFSSGDWILRHKTWIKDAPLPPGEEFVKLY